MLWGRALAQDGGCRINIPEGGRWAISTPSRNPGSALIPGRMADEFSQRPSPAILFMIGPAAFHPDQLGVSGFSAQPGYSTQVD